MEQVAQSVSDTVEQEGIAYVTGEALTAFVPAAGAVKLVKGASKLKGPAKTKGSNSSYSKEFIQGKIDTAKAGLVDVKVPSFTRERLSTGISDISTVRVEMKPLSETHPQIFAVKGNGKAEKQLVEKTGRGSRDWTPDELKELLATGKVKGYEGQHMKSANEYPDFAGDPDNIQFLKGRTMDTNEHLDAHGGNYKNPTNGYYDPNTGVKINFGDKVPWK